MPFEQSRIAIAPAVIMHPNSKNIPKGPMTSKQVKKAYKERNAGPKMTKAEQRKEEQQIREAQRLELEKEKRLEREKRKREKKREEEAAAKAERKKMGVPEKSKWVRPSQNRITGFIALGKRNREDDTITDADMLRENSAAGDMRQPKNKRLSLNMPDEDAGYASPDHDMDTAMLDITLAVSEDDISTVDSQEDNADRTLLKAASQREARPQISDDECTLPRVARQGKVRPQISDDELEPVIEQFCSSQLAEAPNFGTIGDADESSFMSIGRFKTPATKKAAPPSPVCMLADPFQTSQDYDAQCGAIDESLIEENAIIAEVDDVFTPSKAKDLPKLPSQKALKTPGSKAIIRSATFYDLFSRTDSEPQSAQPVQDEIQRTYSPLKVPKTRNAASFETDEDYDYFHTQPAAPSASESNLRAKKTPKKPSQPKSGPQTDRGEDYNSYFPTQHSALSVLKSNPSAQNKAPKMTPKKASQPKARPQISDDEIDYDAFFATQKPNAPVSPLFNRKMVIETPPGVKPQPMAKTKVAEPPKSDPFAASQDYFAMCGDDPFQATQAALPKAPDVARKAMAAKSNISRTMQPSVKPTIAKIAISSCTTRTTKTFAPRNMQPSPKPTAPKTPNNQPPPSTDYDGYFSPEAPHAKPFQKAQPAKTPKMASQSRTLPKQFEASQDYFALCGNDGDYDGDITPVLPAPKLTMSPEHLAKHHVYNMSQDPKGAGAMKPPPQPQGQRIGKFRLPVMPNNAAQMVQSMSSVQSAGQKAPRLAGPTFSKPPVLPKQTSNPVQRPSVSRAPRNPLPRHSAPPRPVQVLDVADDFEIVSGTQLMRELSEDLELNAKTPQQLKVTGKNTGTEHNLSQHLKWLITEAPRPGQPREPLKLVVENVIRPPSFQTAMAQQKRPSHQPAKIGSKPANTGASRFLPQKISGSPVDAVVKKQESAPRHQKTTPKPVAKTAISRIEADGTMDLDDVDLPSGTQLMREMAEEEEQERMSRSVPLVTALRQPAPFSAKPQPTLIAREPIPIYDSVESDSQLMREMVEEESKKKVKRVSKTTRQVSSLNLKEAVPLCKSVESNSQNLRELVEEEDKNMTKKASETPCPPQIKAAPNQNKGQVQPPHSYHIASYELQTLSQIEREMAEEEAQPKKPAQSLIETPARTVTIKPTSETAPNHIPAKQPNHTTSAAAPPPKRLISLRQVPQNYPPPGPNVEEYLMPMPRWPRNRMEMYDLEPVPFSQYEREMAKDDAEDAKNAARRPKKRDEEEEIGRLWEKQHTQRKTEVDKAEPVDEEKAARRERKVESNETRTEKVRKQQEWLRGNEKNARAREMPKKKKLEEINIAEEEILSNSQLMREMEEEEKEETKSRQQRPVLARPTTEKTTFPHPAVPKTTAVQAKKKSDWLTKTAEQRNAVGSVRKGQAQPHLKKTAVSPAMMSVEVEDDNIIMRELAEEGAASRDATPAPVYALSSSEMARELISRRRQASSKQKTPFPTFRSTKGRRQFSGLITPAAKPLTTTKPPPSTPRDAPPSFQPDSRIPSSTPLTVKRARKSLFFQEKPEDREESAVFDRKMRADKDEQKRLAIEEEQRRQDEWLRQLCGTQAAAEMR